MFDIKVELKKIPHRPGCYLMHEGDLILYVGKARDLHNRVRQYFQSPKGKSATILAMVERVEYFEYIVTDSEMEALILENNLIKKHKPPYNTLLKDDKQYPYIKVTTGETYPRIYKTRTIARDKSKYFGPYPSAQAVDETIELMHRLWPLRTCRRVFPRDIGKERPCLNYHIGRCIGPCTGKVSEEEYNEMIRQALAFLGGHQEEVVSDLEKKMQDASAALQFEEAARYRDTLRHVKLISDRQKIEHAASSEERDVIALARDEENALVQVFFVRGGKLTGREHFMLDAPADEPESSLMEAFLEQFYGGTAYIPKEILLEVLPENPELLSSFLSDKRGSQVSLLLPLKGEKKKLVTLARENAELELKQFGNRLTQEDKRTQRALAELGSLLGFEEGSLRRIEAYDISNTFGSLSVGSMVVFEDGKPKPSDYRKFRIKTVIGANDFASLEEVLTRRFSHAINELKDLAAQGRDPSLGSFTRLPDLILMDGGLGQMKAAQAALDNLGLEIEIAGMVKDDRHRTRGLLYHDQEIDFGKAREAFLLVTRVQDEAHRFAITYHRKLRSENELISVLDTIPGIGSVRRKALLTHFGSVDAIKKATLEELQEVPNLPAKQAETVYEFFHSQTGSGAADGAGIPEAANP